MSDPGPLTWHVAACPRQGVRAAATCAVSSKLRTKHTLPSRRSRRTASTSRSTPRPDGAHRAPPAGPAPSRVALCASSDRTARRVHDHLLVRIDRIKMAGVRAGSGLRVRPGSPRLNSASRPSGTGLRPAVDPRDPAGPGQEPRAGRCPALPQDGRRPPSPLPRSHSRWAASGNAPGVRSELAYIEISAAAVRSSVTHNCGQITRTKPHGRRPPPSDPETVPATYQDRAGARVCRTDH